MSTEKLAMHTPYLANANFAALATMFPNAVTEIIVGYEPFLDKDGKQVVGIDGIPKERTIVERAIDADVLAQEINTRVVSGKEERYQFSWPDKRKSIMLANAPIAATLRPCREESVDFDTTENLYIEGDNLDVLKLLRETYLNRVKTIYIDPPYNTGNDFVYEDDFSEDTGEFLRRDGQYDEQGNRLLSNLDSNGRFHTDWLNMIYPRLCLARDLLSEDGSIFISIDDNEVHNLRKICDEIYGANCFVADVSWQRTYSTRNDSKGIVREVEHILVYSKQPNWSPNKLPRTEAMDAIYKNPDNDKAPWTSDNPFAPGAVTHQGMVYAIQHPFTGKLIYPSNSACWRYQQSEMLEIMRGWCRYELKNLNDDRERAAVCGITEDEVRKGVMGIVLSDSLEISSKQARKVYKRGQWPRFYFTKDGTGGIRRKTYLDSVGGKLPTNFWPYSETGHTDEAKKEVLSLFNGTSPFDTPKPTRLIDQVIAISTDMDSIILDFFSGSATTAHSVMKKNAEDNGNRKYILIQIPEVSKSAEYNTLCEIGKERIRRAGAKIKQEAGLMAQNLDIGFRVLRLDSSNMKDVYYTPDQYAQMNFAIDGFIDNIKEDRTEEDLLFQVMLELGIPLSAEITHDRNMFSVNGNYLIACFSRADTALITEIARKQPYYTVFRDSSFTSDSALVNFEQVFNTYSPQTIRRVL